MNKDRRNRISKCIEQLEEIKSELEYIMDEEQDAFDNMPESLQYAERGDIMQECIDGISDAIDGFDDIIDQLNEVIEK